MGWTKQKDMIIIVRPMHVLGVEVTREYLTFGHTPEMRRIWKGFLTLAGVRKEWP